ncbi:MAG TPA: hypothetical protein VEV17_26055 [Bryobacteraceae bacterium]|nr:hypothetical protein [Bryobacteraceae bacterium]
MEELVREGGSANFGIGLRLEKRCSGFQGIAQLGGEYRKRNGLAAATGPLRIPRLAQARGVCEEAPPSLGGESLYS